MKNEIVKKEEMKCVLIRNFGLKIWVNTEEFEKVAEKLDNSTKKFMRIKGELINKADIVGVFNRYTMENDENESSIEEFIPRCGKF